MQDEQCAEIIEVGEGPSVCSPSEQSGEGRAEAVQEVLGYGMKIRVQKPYEDALIATKHALEKEGFGVIFETNVREMFQEKLGVQFPHYTLLGVCKADIAHQALTIDPDLGVLLPCTVAVYELAGGVVVESIDPIAQLSLAGGTEFHSLAAGVKQKLRAVIDHVASAVA
jgi:uncharacterized protein (DUF302 family)